MTLNDIPISRRPPSQIARIGNSHEAVADVGDGRLWAIVIAGSLNAAGSGFLGGELRREPVSSRRAPWSVRGDGSSDLDGARDQLGVRHLNRPGSKPVRSLCELLHRLGSTGCVDSQLEAP